MRDTKFQTWLMANQPPENMIYKQASTALKSK